jgi:hypothetical protein
MLSPASISKWSLPLLKCQKELYSISICIGGRACAQYKLNDRIDQGPEARRPMVIYHIAIIYTTSLRQRQA